MEEVAIKVENVSKDFILPHHRANSLKSVFTGLFKGSKRTGEKQHALKNISFEVKKGEFFGIVGRNGSGKSTLLKLIARIYQPTKGSIHIQGRLVPFIELGVGFNPELTGRENVYLSAALMGFSKKEIDAMYDDIVNFAELKKFMDQKLKNYSSGMQVRLAFSIATRADSDILLIDEVLAVGDADFQRKCFEYFNTLKKAKKTVVFISHDMDAVQKYCDRVMLIEKSEVVEIGETNKIAQKYIRLFHKESVSKAEAQERRWGDEAVKLKDLTVEVSSSLITITQHAVATKDVVAPTCGIRIRSSAGKAIAGTSTQLEKVKLPNLKSRDEFEIEWRMPNVLSDGKYFFDSALAHNDGTIVADWWDEAAAFTVNRNRQLPYDIDLDFKVKLSTTAQAETK
jgi:ABC-2 type transport system ATP-binding protein